MKFLSKRAQSTLEYAIIVAVVVGALLAMQVYIKRGIQGRVRSSTDSIGEQYSAGHVTAKYITEYTGGSEKTVEKVGTDDIGIGVTKTEVTATPTITRAATGDNAEQITKNLTEEQLFQ